MDSKIEETNTKQSAVNGVTAVRSRPFSVEYFQMNRVLSSTNSNVLSEDVQMNPK